jgi:regulator of protease activity HflC (stomatin/prohibitin superfamily)
MSTPSTEQVNRERPGSASSGWTYLGITLLAWVLSIVSLILAIRGHVVLLLVAALVGIVASILLSSGFFTLQPNEGAALVLFGAYQGTVRTSGFHWVNPFVKRLKVSLRARNLNGEKLKVNDLRGNPIEIAAVVVWRVEDTAQALFDVDSYEHYVNIQSESAVRHLASSYAYDDAEPGDLTLRAGGDAIATALRSELQARFDKAGVVVEEARITHLAYAPEIAQAMLRRQQAEAIIAARQKIVHGAVSMVDMALRELSEKQVVVLDDERKAAMVSNLLVVLCGESEVHPVVNAGTLYS